MKKLLAIGVASATLALTALSASAELYIANDFAANPPVIGEEYEITLAVKNYDEEYPAMELYITLEGLEYVSGSIEGANVIFNEEDNYLVYAGMGKQEDGTVICTMKFTVTAEEGEPIGLGVVAAPGFDADVYELDEEGQPILPKTDEEGNVIPKPILVATDAEGTPVPVIPEAPEAPVDEELEAAKKALADLVATVPANNDDGKYTAESWEAFTAAYEEIKLDLEGAADLEDKADVIALTDKLQAALDKLELVEDTSSSTPEGEEPPKTGVAFAVIPVALAGAAIVASRKRK